MSHCGYLPYFFHMLKFIFNVYNPTVYTNAVECFVNKLAYIWVITSLYRVNEKDVTTFTIIISNFTCSLYILTYCWNNTSSSSSPSCHAIGTDILDPHFQPLPIVHCFRLHPVSAQICCMYVRAGRPAFVRPHEGVHRCTSFMSSSLLLQQCPACLVRLILIVFSMGDRWPNSYCFVGAVSNTYSILFAAFLCCCRQAFSPCV